MTYKKKPIIEGDIQNVLIPNVDKKLYKTYLKIQKKTFGKERMIANKELIEGAMKKFIKKYEENL